jgi:hypothetical protein
MVNIISGVMLAALLKSWVLSQLYYQSLFAAGDRYDRFLLLLILFSEPETQKKNKQDECQSNIKMGVHRFHPPASNRFLPDEQRRFESGNSGKAFNKKLQAKSQNN